MNFILRNGNKYAIIIDYEKDADNIKRRGGNGDDTGDETEEKRN